MRIVLAKPRGFCAGVERAIEIVERALELYGAPVYVRHEIVHNKRVVKTLKAKGARFVEEIDDIPVGAVTVFSAHGVAAAIERDARGRGNHVIDATCPLVSKVHNEGARFAAKGLEVVLIGHRGHPEVEGTLGRIAGRVHLVTCLEDVGQVQPDDPEKVAYVTQTTLSVDDTRDIITALRERFPAIAGPDVRDICYATQNRQMAVRALAEHVDVLLVVGASNSSNSNRLKEIGSSYGLPSHLIEDAAHLNFTWLEKTRTIGITAGASAPEELVQEVIDRISERYDVEVETSVGVQEKVRFRLPAELAGAAVERLSGDRKADSDH